MKKNMRPVSEYHIDDAVIENIRQQLLSGKVVRKELPGGGIIHIDRPLPFMVLYRNPESMSDEGTQGLVKGEASYLIASDNSAMRTGLTRLVRTVIDTLSSRNNAFLIIELWAAKQQDESEGNMENPSAPGFRVIASSTRPPTSTVEAFSRALKQIRVFKQKPKVRVDLDTRRTPAALKPLLSIAETRKLNCYVIGLEVYPSYRDIRTGELFPLVLRSLHRGLSRAFKRAFFEFAHTMTTYRPANYHVFGRRSVSKTVFDVDHKLSVISQSFDLILLVTPINIEKAWSQFRKMRCEKMPELFYRPLSVDPAMQKRELFGIRVDNIEDPTLALLFRQKRQELDRRLSMLLDRGKPEFLYGSMQLFGSVDEQLKGEALRILECISPHIHDESMKDVASAGDLALRAEEILAEYRAQLPNIKSTVQVRDDVVGLMVSKGNLMIGKNSRVSRSRVDALIHHEVSTHILTYLNGLAQPFHQLYSGFAGYDGLQEGLAVLSEYLVGGFSRGRLRLLAGRVIAADHLSRGASFVETFRMLNRGFGFNQRTAFTITVRIYRGGGLTKDAVYLRGLIELLEYLKNGGELEPLFVGKIATDHIPLIRELQYREVLKPAPLLPLYFIQKGFTEKIAGLQKGLSPLDLTERR